MPGNTSVRHRKGANTSFHSYGDSAVVLGVEYTISFEKLVI
jgi:hypothetical protein